MRYINSGIFALRKFLRTYINYIIYGYKYNIGYTFACAFCVFNRGERWKYHASAAGHGSQASELPRIYLSCAIRCASFGVKFGLQTPAKKGLAWGLAKSKGVLASLIKYTTAYSREVYL
jgi:hypothetical protein